MSDASFTAEEELEVFGGECYYDVSISLKVAVDFSETGLDWKDALREAVRKQMIDYVNNDDPFGFEFTGPHYSE
jgi:hypothetical protein